jgi:polyisoprenoid-binding protein YceI
MTQRNRAAARRPQPLALAGAIVLLAVLAGAAYGFWYLFVKGSGPAAVGDPSIPSSGASATASATIASGAPSASGSATASASTGAVSGSLDGTWNVDTSIGSFTDFSGTFVGYRVQEELATIGANTAVGRTPDVSGSLTLQGSRISDATITADLTSLKSDDDRRDGQLSRQGLQTSQFPQATFKLSSPIDLGGVPADGQTVKATAKGQLTLHGVAKEVEIPVSAKRSADVVVVTGSLPIKLADYKIPKPSSFAVLSIADQGTMEFQVFFRKT